MSTGLESLMAQLLTQKQPPVESWNPPYCGPIDMRIKVDGSWHYMGTPIGRPAMCKLFASVLRREADGSFVLVTPVEKVGIIVDDAPFVAVALETHGDGPARQLAFRTNVEDVVLANAAHALRVEIDPDSQSPRPYLHVRRGLDALVARAVFYQLVDLALAEHQLGAPLGLWSDGAFFPFGPEMPGSASA